MRTVTTRPQDRAGMALMLASAVRDAQLDNEGVLTMYVVTAQQDSLVIIERCGRMRSPLPPKHPVRRIARLRTTANMLREVFGEAA